MKDKISFELNHPGGIGQGNVIDNGIQNITISQRINNHHFFEVRVSAETIEGKDENLFFKSKDSIGKKIKIQLNDTLFVGIVTKISASKRDNAQGDIIISGCSPTFLLDDKPHTQSFENKTVDEIIKQSKKPYPDNEINFKNDNIHPEFKSKFDYLTQYGESCFGFINRLARNFGEWFYYDGLQTYFGLSRSNEDAILLNFGEDLLSFDVSLSVEHSDFKIIYYDYENNKKLTKTNEDASIASLDELSKFSLNVSKNLACTKPEIFTYITNADAIDDLLKLEVASNADELVVLNGVSSNSKLKIGSVIDLRKNKTSKSDEEVFGKYRIISLTHSCSGLGNYRNDFRAIPEALKSPPPINQRLKPNAPTQPAIVKKNNDPAGLGRVRVQFFWQEKEEMTPWIRVVTSSAGDGRGFYFIPEIGDEVVISFYDNNPDDPYVAGSMFHGKAKPATLDRSEDPHSNKQTTPPQNNTGKGIRTSGGNTIEFSDSADNTSITIISGEGKNIITLQDEGNGSLLIVSVGDIKIKSSGKLRLQSNDSILCATKGRFQVAAKEIFMAALDNIDDLDNIKHESDADTLLILNDKYLGIQAKEKMQINSPMEISVTADKLSAEMKTSLKLDGGLDANLKVSNSLDIDGGMAFSLKGEMVKIN